MVDSELGVTINIQLFTLRFTKKHLLMTKLQVVLRLTDLLVCIFAKYTYKEITIPNP